MLQVDIASLDEGTHTVLLTPTADSLGVDPETFSDIEVALTLALGETQVVADYTARATATLECDRTLEMFDQPVSGSHSVLFTDAGPADEAGDDDVRAIEPSGLAIDLTEPVRDTLVLALPVRRVSPAAEEAELPTVFGRSDDDLADDRWEGLRALRDAPDGDAS